MTENAEGLPDSLYRTVMSSMEHGYVFMDNDGVIRAFNDAACRILGRTPQQLAGNTSADPEWGAIREDGSAFPAERHPIMVSLRSGKPCFGVIMGIRFSADRTRWLSINSDIVLDPTTGKGVGAVATFSDITSQINQQKYLEQSLEDLQSKTRAASENVSYLTTTLLSLVNEIAEANQLVVSTLASGKGAPIEYATIVAQKAEKLKALLSQPHS